MYLGLPNLRVALRKRKSIGNVKENFRKITLLVFNQILRGGYLDTKDQGIGRKGIGEQRMLSKGLKEHRLDKQSNCN